MNGTEVSNIFYTRFAFIWIKSVFQKTTNIKLHSVPKCRSDLSLEEEAVKASFSTLWDMFQWGTSKTQHRFKSVKYRMDFEPPYMGKNKAKSSMVNTWCLHLLAVCEWEYKHNAAASPREGTEQLCRKMTASDQCPYWEVTVVHTHLSIFCHKGNLEKVNSTHTHRGKHQKPNAHILQNTNKRIQLNSHKKSK